MINSFLVTLVNQAAPPTNPSATHGDILWPTNVQTITYTGQELLDRTTLFGGLTGFDEVLMAIQLLWVVEESVLADTITADDPRITYTKDQLVGQFEGTAFDRQQITRLLGQFDTLGPLSYLAGEPLDVYRTALSRMDKLAAVISHFGKRP